MDKIAQDKIEKMTKGGKILGQIMEEAMNFARIGISGLQIEDFVRQKISEYGTESAFTKVRDYKYCTCICINDVVVHGVPTDYKLKEGDVLGIDCGVVSEGFNTDMSWSKIVGQKNDKFMEAGVEALKKAIAQAKYGNRIGHISQAIQETIEKAGYSVVKQLVGHAVGKELHEYPQIPGLLTKSIEKTPEIKEGMTLAIEVIYTMKNPEIVYKNDDGWTISTRDQSKAGLFEATVAIYENRTDILTPFQGLLKQSEFDIIDH